MKKTLIALMALAGIAQAADYELEKVWTLNFGSEYTNGYELTGTMASTGKFWDVDGNTVTGGVTTAGNHRVHMAGGNYGNWADNFQFSITLTLGDPISASNGWPVVAEIAGNGTALRFGPYTNDGNYVAIDGSLNPDSKSSDMNFTLEAGNTYTLTLTKIGNNLTLGVDGKDVAFGYFDSAVSGNITDIALGGNTGGNYRINETVHSVSMSKIVPEPATATLSLLALAGLAARRRRR